MGVYTRKTLKYMGVKQGFVKMPLALAKYIENDIRDAMQPAIVVQNKIRHAITYFTKAGLVDENTPEGKLYADMVAYLNKLARAEMVSSLPQFLADLTAMDKAP